MVVHLNNVRSQLPAGLAVQRVSTADQVASRIREMIWSGQLRPGTHLPEIALAEALRTSRTTVRTAIRHLATEGLLQHEMNRGAVVASLDAGDVHDLYKARRLV